MMKVKRYDTPPGPWWRPVLLAHVEGEERMSASIMCPNNHYATLMDHAIADDGTVTPSVVCFVDGCGFHEFIKLEGWPPE